MQCFPKPRLCLKTNIIMYRSLAHEALMFEPFIKRIFNVTLDMAQIGPWIFFLQNAQIMSQNKYHNVRVSPKQPGFNFQNARIMSQNKSLHVQVSCRWNFPGQFLILSLDQVSVCFNQQTWSRLEMRIWPSMFEPCQNTTLQQVSKWLQKHPLSTRTI